MGDGSKHVPIGLRMGINLLVFAPCAAKRSKEKLTCYSIACQKSGTIPYFPLKFVYYTFRLEEKFFSSGCYLWQISGISNSSHMALNFIIRKDFVLVDTNFDKFPVYLPVIVGRGPKTNIKDTRQNSTRKLSKHCTCKYCLAYMYIPYRTYKNYSYQLSGTEHVSVVQFTGTGKFSLVTWLSS